MGSRKVANQGSFDDPRGVVGSTEDVTFGSPISMNQIVFAVLREPVAWRVARCLVPKMVKNGYKSVSAYLNS